MTNVIQFNGQTSQNLDPDTVLENCKGMMTGLVIAGYGVDGEYFYSSTYGDAKESLWLIEKFKQAIINVHTE